MAGCLSSRVFMQYMLWNDFIFPSGFELPPHEQSACPSVGIGAMTGASQHHSAYVAFGHMQMDACDHQPTRNTFRLGTPPKITPLLAVRTAFIERFCARFRNCPHCLRPLLCAHQMRVCSGCNAERFCSLTSQRAAWRAGHTRVCYGRGVVQAAVVVQRIVRAHHARRAARVLEIVD